jgi:hypothetical protein
MSTDMKWPAILRELIPDIFIAGIAHPPAPRIRVPRWMARYDGARRQAYLRCDILDDPGCADGAAADPSRFHSQKWWECGTEIDDSDMTPEGRVVLLDKIAGITHALREQMGIAEVAP